MHVDHSLALRFSHEGISRPERRPLEHELQPPLADDLIARMEEKVYVEDESELRRRKPDVRITEMPLLWQANAGNASTAVLDESVLLEPLGDPIRQ